MLADQTWYTVGIPIHPQLFIWVEVRAVCLLQSQTTRESSNGAKMWYADLLESWHPTMASHRQLPSSSLQTFFLPFFIMHQFIAHEPDRKNRTLFKITPQPPQTCENRSHSHFMQMLYLPIPCARVLHRVAPILLFSPSLYN